MLLKACSKFGSSSKSLRNWSRSLLMTLIPSQKTNKFCRTEHTVFSNSLSRGNGQEGSFATVNEWMESSLLFAQDFRRTNFAFSEVFLCLLQTLSNHFFLRFILLHLSTGLGLWKGFVTCHPVSQQELATTCINYIDQAPHLSIHFLISAAALQTTL